MGAGGKNKGKKNKQVDNDDDDDDSEYSIKYFRQWTNRIEKQLKNGNKLPVSIDEYDEEYMSHLQNIKKKLTVRDNKQKELDELEKKKKKGADDVDASDIERVKEVLQNTKRTLQETMDECQISAETVLNKPEMVTLLSASDFDDTDLITYVILKECDAKELSEWCRRKNKQQKQDDDNTTAELLLLQRMIDFLNDADMKRLFMIGGGARNCKWMNAIEIYYQIQPSTSTPAGDDIDDIDIAVLERLRIAVSLELAEPLPRFDNPKLNIDPIQRYKHYEQAYLNGELDPVFSQFTIWELRLVVDSDASDDELTWGRQSLCNFKPNFVLYNDPQWRYCMIVKSDVPYKAPDWYKTTHTYDQILSGGGKCGPRAWYGRFACKCFGIPTWGCKQPGHAAMTRWTSSKDGWMTCLGGGWHVSFWDNRRGGKYRSGHDFLLETRARNVINDDAKYIQTIMRLSWIGSMLCDENDSTIRNDVKPDPKAYWMSLALMKRYQIVGKVPNLQEQQQQQRLQYPQSTLPNKIRDMLRQAATQEQDDNNEKEAIYKDDDGSIIIPVASYCKLPKKNKSNADVIVRTSFLGGEQVFVQKSGIVEIVLPHDDDDNVFFPTDTTNKYEMTMKVCTAHRNGEKPMLLTITPGITGGGSNGNSIVVQQGDIPIQIPYTMALWDETKPIIIECNARSILSLARQQAPHGFNIKTIQLKPIS